MSEPSFGLTTSDTVLVKAEAALAASDQEAVVGWMLFEILEMSAEVGIIREFKGM